MEENKKNEKEMEQWNDVKDKKGSGVVIVLLLLIIAGLGLFIYFNKDKLFGEKETKPEEAEKQETNTEKSDNQETNIEEKPVTFTEEELMVLINKIDPGSIGPSALTYNKSHIVAAELTPADKMKYTGLAIKKKESDSREFHENIISEEDVKSIVESTYGPNTYERATFNLGCGDYIYNEEDGYYHSKTGCGGTTMVIAKRIITDYTATNKKVVITTAYAFYDGNRNKLYKDFDLTEEAGDYDSSTSPEVFLDNFIKEHKDELHHIVYTFESPDGVNYYFKEFTNDK